MTPILLPHSIVTPAQAGAHPEVTRWIPAFAGMTAGGGTTVELCLELECP